MILCKAPGSALVSIDTETITGSQSGVNWEPVLADYRRLIGAVTENAARRQGRPLSGDFPREGGQTGPAPTRRAAGENSRVGLGAERRLILESLII